MGRWGPSVFASPGTEISSRLRVVLDAQRGATLADGNDGRYEFDDFHKGYLLNQIKRLKRVLGMYKTSEERRSATKERVQRHRERWQEQRAQWRTEREAKESVSLPRSTGLLGSVGAAYKYLLQAGKEPTAEAITEFLNGRVLKSKSSWRCLNCKALGTWTESARKFSAPDIHGQVAEAAMISILGKE
jgi:hypothetical protein